jgi:hypothetical protein
MARRRPPFIQVLAPAVTLFGLATACTGPKRHDDGSGPTGSSSADGSGDPSDTEESADDTGAGDTGAQ